MNVQRSLWLALPLVFLLPLGCNNAGTGQPAEATEAATEAPAPAEHAARHGHHAQGPVAMLFHAARDLDLTQAQRTTVDDLWQQLHGERGSARAGHQAMHAALVDGVRAGAIDMSRVAPLQAAEQKDHQARAERQAAALDGLWAALQPAQRQAVVASVRERQAERAARWGNRPEGAGKWEHKRNARLTAELGLDASQQQQVEGILAASRPSAAAREARHEEMKKRTDALLAAFVADTFDARKLDLASPDYAVMGPPLFRPEVLAQVVPILRADQREKLAASMEKGRG